MAKVYNRAKMTTGELAVFFANYAVSSAVFEGDVSMTFFGAQTKEDQIRVLAKDL